MTTTIDTLTAALVEALRAIESDKADAARARRSVVLAVAHEDAQGELVRDRTLRFATVEAAERRAAQLRRDGYFCEVAA